MSESGERVRSPDGEVRDDPEDDPRATYLPTVDRRADLAIAICVAVLGIAIVYLARDIRHGAIIDPIGPGGFATALGTFLAVVGAILVVRRVASWRRSADGQVDADGGSGDEPGLPASGIRPFVLLTIGFSWALLLPRIGFIVATWLACAAGLLSMRTRTVLKLALIPLLFSLFTWVLFTRLSGLRFPAGPVDLFFATLIPRLD